MSEEVREKQCVVCLQTFPDTLEYFHFAKENKNQRRSTCKACRKEQGRKSREKSKNTPRVFSEDVIKTCRGCLKPFPATPEYFILMAGTKDGLAGKCRSCRNETSKRWRDSHKDRVLELGRNNRKKNIQKVREREKEYRKKNPEVLSIAARKYFLKKQYGLSPEEYDSAFRRQGNVCAICGKTKKEDSRSFHVDHCHVSGNLRGILCAGCNFILGYAGDDIKVLEKAISYLKNPPGVLKEEEENENTL